MLPKSTNKIVPSRDPTANIKLWVKGPELEMELDLESELQSLFVHEMSVAEPEKRFYVAGNK